MSFSKNEWVKCPSKGVGKIIAVNSGTEFIVNYNSCGLVYDKLSNAVQVTLKNNTGYIVVSDLIRGSTFDDLFE